MVDAETGKPVESFTVLPGIDWENNPNTYWEGERQQVAQAFRGGTRSRSASQGQGTAFGVEADGYLPAVSRAFKDDEGEVVYDVKLKRGAGVTGTVVGTDGKPLTGVTAVLVTPNTRAS